MEKEGGRGAPSFQQSPGSRGLNVQEKKDRRGKVRIGRMQGKKSRLAEKRILNKFHFFKGSRYLAFEQCSTNFVPNGSSEKSLFSLNYVRLYVLYLLLKGKSIRYYCVSQLSRSFLLTSSPPLFAFFGENGFAASESFLLLPL